MADLSDYFIDSHLDRMMEHPSRYPRGRFIPPSQRAKFNKLGFLSNIEKCKEAESNERIIQKYSTLTKDAGKTAEDY